MGKKLLEGKKGSVRPRRDMVMEFNVRTSQEEAFSKTVADAKIKINYEVFSLG